MVAFLDILVFLTLCWSVLGVCWFAYSLYIDVYAKITNPYRKLLFFISGGPLIWVCCLVAGIGILIYPLLVKYVFLESFIKWLQKP